METLDDFAELVRAEVALACPGCPDNIGDAAAPEWTGAPCPDLSECDACCEDSDGRDFEPIAPVSMVGEQRKCVSFFAHPLVELVLAEDAE